MIFLVIIVGDCLVVDQLRTRARDAATLEKDHFAWFFEVEHTGNFNFKYFYQAMHRWLKYEGWRHWQDGGDKIEDLYWVHEAPGGTSDILCFWRLKKDINRWIRYFVKIDFQLLGVKKVEVMINNKKKKIDSLNLTMRLWWWVQFDPNDLWEKSKFKFLKNSFYKYLFKDEVTMHVEKLKVESYRLMEMMKKYFGMATLYDHPRTFFPEKGYEWDVPEMDEQTDVSTLDRKFYVDH